MNSKLRRRFAQSFFALLTLSLACHAQHRRLDLTPEMLVNEADLGTPDMLIDEQDEIIGPPVGKPESAWRIPSNLWTSSFPCSVHFDLGAERHLATLWLFDTHNNGKLVVSAGKPGAWEEIATYGCGKYMEWTDIPLNTTARYLRLTRVEPSAIFTEIAIYEYSDKGWKAYQAKKAAEAKARAEREAALAKARAEMAKRPIVDLGEPFGEMALVDEINCGTPEQGHRFVESPDGNSEIKTLLDRPCRVVKKTTDECAYISYRIGEMKLLMPGQPYVLAIEYPEDAPRSMVVMNSGCETSRGFHTGRTFGDALHPKYVNNLNESISTPLSGEYEQWTQLFWLHDRFPNREFLRGDKPRPLTPEDGFTVTIAQFSARNIPASHGAAVARIRLFAFVDEPNLEQPLNLPPGELPQRRIFWREEMADGVIGSSKNEKRGIENPLDWYRYKANLMHFLGVNTYTKDLLEFGACQHWDSTPYGGHKWVYYNAEHKDLWGNIVKLMSEEGFALFPYYEYSGSKGRQGLGKQRRAKPLTRDDAYTHIKWIEKANADITDPDTYKDFQKMLDLTILQYTDQARFLGAWLRPRGQLPIGFGAATRRRFSEETNRDQTVTRQQLIDDENLLDAYYEWWFLKRREFLAAMRDYLRDNGVDNAGILFTDRPGEPGVGFPTWNPVVPVDKPSWWKPILEKHDFGDRPLQLITPEEVVEKEMYLEALTSWRLTWGDWEVHHGAPPADPRHYKDTEGVLLSHAFNRLYTVMSPKTFNAFRTPGGLAIVRHYTLNENMMYDLNDKSKLGYFVADIEKAGPFCMQAEALAVANGDPTMIGYLSGNSYSRGFPRYVRNFNAAFLALPALPSKRLPDASPDPDVVVREIRTEEHGSYYAVVNTAMTEINALPISLPIEGKVVDAATGRELETQDGNVRLSMYPCQLRALRIKP